MSEMLAELPGVALEVTATGADAVAAVQRTPPDLLLLDMHLPDSDGLALLARLRSQPGLAFVPAVVVSATAMADDIDRARQAGFDDYWTKPLRLERVWSDLEGLLHGPPPGLLGGVD